MFLSVNTYHKRVNKWLMVETFDRTTNTPSRLRWAMPVKGVRIFGVEERRTGGRRCGGSSVKPCDLKPLQRRSR